MYSITKEFGRLQKSGDFGNYVTEIDQLLETLSKARATIDSGM